jgi:hypothetical protein
LLKKKMYFFSYNLESIENQFFLYSGSCALIL